MSPSDILLYSLQVRRLGPYPVLLVIASALDTLHMGFVLHYAYTMLVNQSILTPWTLPAAILVNLVNDSIIRIFFTQRIWILAFLGIIILAVFGISFYADAITYEATIGSKSEEKTSRNTYYKGTRAIIRTLVQYTIPTGLLATFWSIRTLLSYGLKPNSNISLIFYLSLSKIYVNALLASLNARDSLREKSRNSYQGPRDDANETKLKTIAFASRASHQITVVGAPANASICTVERDNKIACVQANSKPESSIDISRRSSAMMFEAI
ncbi:hypothetical protein SCHPADRAFT_57647 [Schizopora paradoxa]|uniref:DUF6534 domain-containing protein n=1 Tax=Schizopora paradoxa TaxID=27342 RepID=A0A0H2S670_9AGAM|nr:hypothetical protein SCHPADRAFT_57647 [Schizopora paradoxa]